MLFNTQKSWGFVTVNPVQEYSYGIWKMYTCSNNEGSFCGLLCTLFMKV